MSVRRFLLVVCVVFSFSVFATPRVLVIDAGDTDTGALCARLFRHLDAKTDVRKVDIAHLPEAAKEKWDLAAIVGPEPLLYHGRAKDAYESIIENAATGLLIIRLPHDYAGKKELLKSLSRRNPPDAGVHFPGDFEGANWIWSNNKKTPDERLSIIKMFELSEAPTLAWMQITADNDAHVWINGKDVGNTITWRSPACFNVASVLKQGENVIALDAWNQDGPAGVLATLVAFDADGRTLANVKSDASWDFAPGRIADWDHISKPGNDWKPVKKLFPYGEGYWQTKLAAPFPAFESPILQGETVIGRGVLTDGLRPDAGSTTIATAGRIPVGVATEGGGGRLVIYSIDPEAAEGIGDVLPAVASNGFANQLLDQARWLARIPANVHMNPLPNTAPSGATLSLALSSAPPASSYEVHCLLRDEQRTILDTRETLHSVNDPIELKLPQAWTVRGSLHATIAVTPKGIQTESFIGTIALTTPVKIKLSPKEDRWVYRADETLSISATTSDPKIAPSNLRAMINSSDGQTRLTLASTNAWTVDLSSLSPGRYDFVVNCLSPDQQIIGHTSWRFDIVTRPDRDRIFTRAIQFTTIPHYGVAENSGFPRSRAGLRREIDEIMNHGFNCLYAPSNLPTELAAYVESYAQSRGMFIMAWPDSSQPIEMFNRERKPPVNIYSPEYPKKIREEVEGVVEWLHRYPRLSNAVLFMDEPFWQHDNLWPMDELTKSVFKKRYGYDLPAKYQAARDPKKWMDLLNFRTAYFSDAWKQVYPIIKKLDSSFDVQLNHDSHNTFGGGAGQESPIATDDAFHWGGHDFADVLSWDIYPYLMSDFRYGPNRLMKLPTIAQLDYTAAYMRDLTEAQHVRFGYWYGPWNSEWFDLTEEGRKQYWMERETAYTAVAHGANMLITGIGIPQDQHHWDDLGDSMRTLAKVDEQIVQAPRVRAKAAMLFPRTQYLMLQEEYFGVGQSYEAFSRAFGELDILHEEQVAQSGVGDYKILVLFDVKLLPKNVMEKIEQFVKAGGIVIGDCVPNMDELKQPTSEMDKVFGVSNAQTDRLEWPVLKPYLPHLRFRVVNPMFSGIYHATSAKGEALGVPLDLVIASPRSSTPAGAKVLAKMSDGSPLLSVNQFGKGRAYLLGFCLQDTDFVTWARGDVQSRMQLQQLLHAITKDAKVASHVRSSNPDVEAAVRANQNEGFLFVISHEARNGKAEVEIRDLPFKISKVTNIATDKPVEFHRDGNAIELHVNAPTGTTYLMKLN